MKPTEWNTWNQDQKRQYAEDLIFSVRGHFLMNEALSIAAAVLRNQEAVSNAEDLDMIREAMFHIDHSKARMAMLPIDQLETEED